jgi:hypothetical protein
MWYIPVSYATQQEMKDATNSSTRYIPRLWLKKEPTTTIHNLTKSKSNETWVLFNIDATGALSILKVMQGLRIKQYVKNFVFH